MLFIGRTYPMKLRFFGLSFILSYFPIILFIMRHKVVLTSKLSAATETKILWCFMISTTALIKSLINSCELTYSCRPERGEPLPLPFPVQAQSPAPFYHPTHLKLVDHQRCCLTKTRTKIDLWKKASTANMHKYM